MNKRQHKKRLRKKKAEAILKILLDAFHNETLLIAKNADQKLVEHIKFHYEIADEYAERRSHHKELLLNHIIEKFESAGNKLERQNHDFIYFLVLFTIVNAAICIISWLAGA